ncbi:hypothetical protein DFH07DRAFT_814744 [Mycena maculata]|uniref:F-box domain-containing protein n=1 Tax=Mycena maculata TaxID=230809 RepID=A0AAD7JEZ5_9AGAR|nr:hypothetical protein DFH07DRAFT_814744 [Mycena maculata]
MNAPGAFLVNLFVTEEEALEARENMAQNQLLMASLDAEIAKAQAALKELVSQRTAAQLLLESNSAPSDTEARAIREIIISKETQMGQLEDEIAETRAALNSMIEGRAQVAQQSGPSSGALEKFDADIEGARTVLKGLLTERDQTHDVLEAHKALLSPIRRIPPEVLGEIFTHCLPKDPFIEASVAHCPLLLTQISSSWRSVALATPALWTSLAVNLSITSCLPKLSLIQTWIARSGSCPLSFHIAESIQKDYYEPGMTTSAAVLELYAPHYARWHHLRLECQDWRIDTGFSKLPCDAPPRMLESLYLARDFWRRDEQDQLSLMLSAPRLRDCTWISNTDLGTFHAPFPQLSKLLLERPLVTDDFMHILNEGANLEECQFFVLASPTSNLGPTATPLALRHNLRILDLTADLFGRLFAQLELPRLTDISVRRFDLVPHHTPIWPQQEFMSLLTRSKCALERISLSDMDIAPADMSTCLRHTSASLQKLILTNDRRMRHTIINDDVLRLLTWGAPEAGGSQLCPQLSFVKFWDCHSSTDAVLADMVESRWKARDGGPTKLLSIAFFMLDSTHVEDLRRLDILNAERLGLSILRRDRPPAMLNSSSSA